MTHPGILSVTFLLAVLGGMCHAELCYTDANTGAGVYCEPDCCGNPVYCCDKDSLTIESAVFGTLGLLMIVCMVVCVVCKKLKKKKKLRNQVLPVSKKPVTISVVVAAAPAGLNDGPVQSSEKSSSFHHERGSRVEDGGLQPYLPNVPTASVPPPSYGDVTSKS